MASGGGSSEPSAEQQELSAEQLRLEEERLELERQAAEAERQQLELLNAQIEEQSASNEQILAELRIQNEAAVESNNEFAALLESAVELQETEAALQSQEATRAESRAADADRTVQTGLLSTQRDVQARQDEIRRRRQAGSQAPITTSRERRAASLLQR